MARKNPRRDRESSSPCDSALGDHRRRTRSQDQNCNERIASISADCSEWFRASSRRSYTRLRSTRIKRVDMDTLWPPSDSQVSRPFTRLQSRKCGITSVSFSTDCYPCSKPSKRRKDSQSESIIDLSYESGSRSSEISTRETYVRSRTSRKKQLDTNAFQNCFEQIFAKLPEEKRESFCFLDCLWFSLYFEKSESSREKVLRWIKCKHVFRKKYILIPIVRWRHWNLLILCHFGEISPSQRRTPCMLLLDSLRLANPKRHEVEIRRFVLDIYRADGISDPEMMAMISRAPLLLPKVPQQRNQECGHFVLYYANLFAENAPEDFSTLDYPYFMKEDWFCPSDLNSFCNCFYNMAAATKHMRFTLKSCKLKKRTDSLKNPEPGGSVIRDFHGTLLCGEIYWYPKDKECKKGKWTKVCPLDSWSNILDDEVLRVITGSLTLDQLRFVGIQLHIRSMEEELKRSASVSRSSKTADAISNL